jgi:hypothetical protein
MSLQDAIVAAGIYPEEDAPQARKKRYSEVLSAALAQEVAHGLRNAGFPNVKPERNGPGEKAFQGGLGPKKVDVSYANEQNGLLLAVSIKTITSPPFGKNLKNRFSDLCTEAITLHLRFPYSVVCALFAFPASADTDVTAARHISTFRRARQLLSTISGRGQYTDPGEKFENVVLMLFEPRADNAVRLPYSLVDAITEAKLSESDYFDRLREVYNRRNPHAPIGELDGLDEDGE